MPSIHATLAAWHREQTRHTARGLAQVLWATVRGSDAPHEEVDAGLALLAQIELGRVDACDRGDPTFVLSTPIGGIELRATPEPPLVDPLAIVFGALCAEREDELDRCATWSLRNELRRPRDVGWFAPTLVDLVLARVAGRDTTPLLRTAHRILPESHRLFADFVVTERRTSLAASVHRLGPTWALGARALLKPARLSAAGHAAYVARRDALDRDADALVRRLDAFVFAPSDVVASAILAESEALGHDPTQRLAVAYAALRAFLATSEEAIPTTLSGALVDLAWSDACALLAAYPAASERLASVLARLAPPTRQEATELLAAAAVPRSATVRALVALERWPEVLALATHDDAHARAAAHLGCGAPREALRALARCDDAEAQRLRRLALQALGEPTLAASGAWAARLHPFEPERALEALATLEPATAPSTRAAALRPKFVTVAWVRSIAAAGAIAHACELARGLRIEELLAIATDRATPWPELLWVALDRALAPTGWRHPYATFPARELEAVLAAIHRALPDSAWDRVAARASSVVDVSLRATLDGWLERHAPTNDAPAEHHAPTNDAPAENHAPSTSPERTTIEVAPGIVRRKRRP